MIVIRKKRLGREFLFLGLTAGNIERLVAGHPMRISGETHQEAIPPGWTVGIIYGANMEELRRELEKAGIITAAAEPGRKEGSG